MAHKHNNHKSYLSGKTFKCLSKKTAHMSEAFDHSPNLKNYLTLARHFHCEHPWKPVISCYLGAGSDEDFDLCMMILYFKTLAQHLPRGTCKGN